jgi:phosphate transport system permease protein
VAVPDVLGNAQPARSRLGTARRHWGEDLGKAVLALCACLSIATTVGIVIALLEPAIEFFGTVSITDFYTGTKWAPLFQPAHFGVVPLVLGTLKITAIACVVCVPCGLGAAIYMSEYARPRVRAVLKPGLEVLAGIPTVVFGYFALTLMTPLLRDIGIHVDIFNALSAGIVVGIMLIPTVASVSEDAMQAVPVGLRQGSYALGATKYQTSTHVIVPAAISGIIASFVLAISRAVGETMIVAIGAGLLPTMTLDPRLQTETMTAFIAATGIGDVPTGSIEYKTIFAVGLTLFAMTLVLNLFAIRMVRRFREVYE